MRYLRWVRAAIRNPPSAFRFASNHFKRTLRKKLLRVSWLYARLDLVSRRYSLQKILDPEVFGKSPSQFDDVLKNRLTILGKTLEFASKIDWLADFEGGEWPNLPSNEYDRLCANGFSLPEYRKHGDIKRVWDLNKHHHFVDLARAYRETQDPKYQAEMVSQFLDWTNRFPYTHGIGWNQPLIAAQRAINWIICYSLDAFPQNLLMPLTTSLFYHGKYLSENLEISYLGNNSNHLIGELAALHLIGLTLQKQDWANRSLKMLLSEVGKQVYEDGVDYEQSSGYHRYVLEFLTLVWYANGKEPPLFTDIISKMSNFLNDIVWGDGSLPFLSDWDGAKVWVSDHHRPVELYRLGRGSPTSVAYRDGGYYILKGGPFHLIFDCGPVGMAGKQLATHGHSDLLSFTLAIEGEPFIIDPGSGTYTENKNIHDYFRSTSGHNTITIDGRDQCGLAGFWTLEKHPKARLVRWETSEDLDTVCGEHDGYQPIIHRREIQLRKKPIPTLKIYDEIIGNDVHNYQCYFHLAPNILCRASGTTLQLVSSKSCLRMSFEPTLTVREVKGWFAPDYGPWIEAPVLVFEGRSDLPSKMFWQYEIG